MTNKYNLRDKVSVTYNGSHIGNGVVENYYFSDGVYIIKLDKPHNGFEFIEAYDGDLKLI